MSITRRGVFKAATSSRSECRPMIFLPAPRPFMKSSTFSTVRLLTATVKPRLSMFSTRFSPITARPISPISALSICACPQLPGAPPPDDVSSFDGMTRKNQLPLDACRPALGEGAHLLDRRHGGVAGEGGEQGAVRPAELDRLFRRFAGEKAVEEAPRKAVAAADAVEYVEIADRGHVRLAVDPRHGAPAVPIGAVHLAERGGHRLHVGVLGDHLFDHVEEGLGVERRLGGHFGARNAETLLQILFVADQDVDVLDDASDHFDGLLLTAPDVPQLLAEVEVEAGDGAGGFGRLHRLDDELASGLRERREDAAAVDPAHAAGHDLGPIEVARLELRGRLVGSVVEDDGRANTVAPVAVDGGHVGAVDAVVLEALVKRFDPHGANAFGDEIADGVVDHGGGDARIEAERVAQVGGDVEFAAAHVDVAMSRLAKRDDARVQAMHHCSQAKKIERAARTNVQPRTHRGCSPYFNR